MFGKLSATVVEHQADPAKAGRYEHHSSFGRNTRVYQDYTLHTFIVSFRGLWVHFRVGLATPPSFAERTVLLKGIFYGKVVNA